MKKVIDSLTNDVVMGMRNPLEVYKIFLEAENSLKKAKEIIKEDAMIEWDKYEEKTVEFQGYSISKIQSARYDYNHIEAWKNQKEKLSLIEEKAKLANQLGESVVIESTGEIIQPAIKKYNPETLSFKHKR